MYEREHAGDAQPPEHTAVPGLSVVFLIGADSRSTRMSIEAVCAIPGVIPVAAIVDTAQTPFRRRLKNFRQNLRRNGWRYIPHRILEALRAKTDAMADSAVLRPGEVEQLLRKAFPDDCHSLLDLAAKYRFIVRKAGNLNGPEAIAALRQCHADLGIVLGTRILKPTTFSVPRMGCINLHKGKVPQYRGMPPGFWELYDGAGKAGVTVHFVDSKLDTGDVVEAAEVDILPREIPETLLEKLHQEGTRALVRAVTSIRDGVARPIPQGSTTLKPRTKPTLLEIATLRGRLPHWREDNPAAAILKNLIYLAIYHSGVYALVSRLRGGSRAGIVLYHRVNDFSHDVLTVDRHLFAAQLLAISKRYRTMTSGELVATIRGGRAVPATTVLIHFDDAYRDVYTNAGPILKAAGIPATSFVNSGYVDTDRQFAHDVEKYTFRYENCSTADLRDWTANGFEIGAHTVNHVDLGACTLDEARMEIVESGAELERMTGQPVRLFSFPFGRLHNIRPETRDLIREAGYDAVFSASGGFVGGDTDRWDIPRLGASSRHKPLWLLMELEGLAPAYLSEILKSPFGRLKNRNKLPAPTHEPL